MRMQSWRTFSAGWGWFFFQMMISLLLKHATSLSMLSQRRVAAKSKPGEMFP